MAIKTGIAVRRIPTPAGMPLTGYIARLHPSTGTHDPLCVRCVAFDDGSRRVVFAVCDLLGLTDVFVKGVQARVEAATGLPPESVVVGCVHTHSAPASIHLENCGEPDPMWMAGLESVIVDCVGAALASLEPSRLRFRTGSCAMAFNRVVGRADADPGPIDAQVSVLEITRGSGGAPRAMLCGYACHPVSLTADNLQCSRDYPHFLEQALRAEVAPDLDVVFMTGCCGDIDPIRRGGFAEAERGGRELARAVLAADGPGLDAAGFQEARIDVRAVRIRLPLERRFTDAELSGFIRDYEQRAAAREPGAGGAGAGAPDVEERMARAHADYARRMLAAAAAGTLRTEIQALARVIRIGGLVVVTHPFEAFHEIGLALKARFGASSTMVMGYADGDFGYLASAGMYDRAAYEVNDAFVYYGFPGPLPRDAGARFLDAVSSGACG
jgi:neutral ceramidase